MASPIFATATEIAQWADRRDSQSYLPQLVRRLIRAVTSLDDVKRVEFRSGEGIALSGYDGVSEVVGDHEFVPGGLAVWEMGVNKSIKGKADDDYTKRSDDPGEITPEDAAFVFVTPRRWGGKKSWQAAKRAEGKWRSVHVIDADDIEAWLEQAPSVHAWLTTVIGREIAFAEDLETFWERWSTATDPPLSANLVIGGRDETARQLIGCLTSDQHMAVLQTMSAEEALAFLAAAIHLMPDAEKEFLLADSIIVRDSSTWLNLCATRQSLLLIPDFDEPDVARALRHQHRVFIPDGATATASHNVIDLPPVKRSAARVALEEMGVPEDQARELSILARRSFQSLRRRIALAPSLKRPEWSLPAHAPSIVPAVLAGAWEDSVQGDRSILSSLSGQDYAELESILTRWRNESDPPVVRVGTAWYFVSTDDAWPLLRPFLTSDRLSRFRAACVDVLAEPDPAIALAPSERWSAGLRELTQQYSPLLRQSLANAIAVIGTRSGADRLPNGSTGATFSSSLVSQLIQQATDDPSGATWSTLLPVLPLLAEAAPDAFLTGLATVLQDEESSLIRLLRESEEEDGLFGRHVDASLIWALECLAWSVDYFSRAALLLAEVARVLPDGTVRDHG